MTAYAATPNSASMAMFWITRATKPRLFSMFRSRACRANTYAATGIMSANRIRKAVNA
jgi:hypothetical protein